MNQLHSPVSSSTPSPETIAKAQSLVQKLSDSFWYTRRTASDDLAFLSEKTGYKDLSVVRALISALRDRDTFVRKSAAWALGRVGADHKDLIIPELMRVLDIDNSFVRVCAAWSLATLGSIDPKIVEALLHLVTYNNKYIIWSALEGIGDLKVLDERIMVKLLQLQVAPTTPDDIERAGHKNHQQNLPC